jgi:hypothetical protein
MDFDKKAKAGIPNLRKDDLFYVGSVLWWNIFRVDSRNCSQV